MSCGFTVLRVGSDLSGISSLSTRADRQNPPAVGHLEGVGMFPFPPFALPAKNLIRDLWFCGLLAWNDLLEMARPAGRSPDLGRRNDRNSDYRPAIDKFRLWQQPVPDPRPQLSLGITLWLPIFVT